MTSRNALKMESKRKRPSNEQRVELVIPAELKARAATRARQEQLPLQVWVRIAMERLLDEDPRKPLFTSIQHREPARRGSSSP